MFVCVDNTQIKQYLHIVRIATYSKNVGVCTFIVCEVLDKYGILFIQQ